MTDIDDLLDDRMTGGTGDYPPWFDEEGTGQGEPPVQEDGDVLQGVVTKVRDDPFYDPNDEDEPKPILHVQTDSGNEWSTRTHTVLVDLIDDQDVEEGDYVRILKDGSFKTDNGQVANDYQLGVVKSDELDEVETDDSGNEESAETTDSTSESDTEETEGTDGHDLEDMTVQDVKGIVQTVEDVDTLEEMAAEEMAGKDRKTAKQVIQERIDEIQEPDEPEEEETEDTGDIDDDVPGDVLEFAESLMSFHGELTIDELDDYLNDTRDFDIEPERVVAAMDVEQDGDTVTA